MDKISEIEADIKALKIQGATNVAKAVLQGIKISLDQDISDLKKIASRLAFARPTEPLAQNAVRYIFTSSTNRLMINQKITSYEQFIDKAKSEIISNSSELVKNNGVYLTHCHSSTTISVFKEACDKNHKFSVYVTETRPLYQGRITAKELITSGIDKVTFLIDDAVFSLINQLAGKINGIFIGADLLSTAGFVNKIGSFGIVSEANKLHIPVFSFSTLLKYDPKPFDNNILEKRSSGEIWSEAPVGLSFYAPAFDFVPYFDNVSIVTEVGIIKGSDVRNQALMKYPFIKD